MDPNVRQAFDEMRKALEDLDARSAQRWGLLEGRFNEAEEALQERERAVDDRIYTLEQFASVQYTAAVVADNWGGLFKQRLEDFEQRMREIEDVRYAECRDERDARTEALEAAVGDLQMWQMEADANIDDLHLDVHRLVRMSLPRRSNLR